MSLGMHVSKKGRGSKSRKMNMAIAEDVKYMESFGIQNPSVQIFVTGPKSAKETLTADEKASIKDYIERTNTKLVIHGAYIDRPWSGSQDAIKNVQLEMRIASEICATGVIVHLGASVQNEGTFSSALRSIGDCVEGLDPKPILWLEIHTAKPCAATFETSEKLAKLFERIAGYNLPYTCGLCIDTAHLFSCGMALDTYQAAEMWIEALPNVPIMMHLNDSARALGCGIDAHAPILYGNIWSTYHPDTGNIPFEMSGLNYLLAWAEKNKILTILERDDNDLHKDLALVNKMGYYR